MPRKVTICIKINNILNPTKKYPLVEIKTTLGLNNQNYCPNKEYPMLSTTRVS